jgi:hypothetical protein
MMINDASDRFADVGDFDEFPTYGFFLTPPLWWRPWAEAPLTAEFRYAFQIIGPASTVTPLRLSIQELSAHNVMTSQDPLQRKTDPDMQTTQELRYNGIPVIRVEEQQKLDKNVGVRFVDICRNAIDTRLQGYLSLTSSVGGGGHHVFAVVSQGQVLDMSPPKKSQAYYVKWVVIPVSISFFKERRMIVSDFDFKIITTGDEIEPNASGSVASVFRVVNGERQPIQFEANKEPGLYKAFDLPVMDDLKLVVNLDSGAVIEAGFPGLVFVPFAERDEVALEKDHADTSVWSAIAEAAGGLSTVKLDAPLHVAKVHTWRFEAIPYYTPRRYGKSAPEDTSPVSRELNRAILNGSVDDFERLFGTEEPFTFKWTFRAINAVTGERLPVIETDKSSPKGVGVMPRDGRFPKSALQVSFPETGTLIKLFAVASVKDALGNSAEVVKVIWNHVLSAKRSQSLAEGILPMLARLSNLQVEDFVEAAIPLELGEDQGFVDFWISDPSLAAAQHTRTAAEQSAIDGRITVDELAQLIGAAQHFAQPKISDEDGDGISDLIDLCPKKDDRLDSDRDGYPDCLDNCPKIHNPDQYDSDADGKGDAC